MYMRARARTHTHTHTHTQREREREGGGPILWFKRGQITIKSIFEKIDFLDHIEVTAIFTHTQVRKINVM